MGGRILETHRQGTSLKPGTGRALSLRNVLFVKILAGQARQALVIPGISGIKNDPFPNSLNYQ